MSHGDIQLMARTVQSVVDQIILSVYKPEQKVSRDGNS